MQLLCNVADDIVKESDHGVVATSCVTVVDESKLVVIFVGDLEWSVDDVRSIIEKQRSAWVM